MADPTEVDTMCWFDIAITNKDAFIVNCDEGFREFLESIWWEDNFQIDAPIHLPTGVYRWQQFSLGYWSEDEAMNVSGGEFVPYVLPEQTLPAKSTPLSSMGKSDHE